MINTILTEVLSSMAEQERITIHARHEEWIDAAKAKGKHLGRPKATFPDKWGDICPQWVRGEITAVAAMKLLGIKKSTFYKLVQTHKDNTKQ